MAVDLDLPPARVDLRTYAHDLELSSLVVDLEREFGRERVSTERELRAADTPLAAAPAPRPLFSVPLAGARGALQLTPAGHPRLHFPDCGVVGRSAESADRVLAIEFERTAKGRARLRRILAGYVAARHISAVRYYTLGERVRELVKVKSPLSGPTSSSRFASGQRRTLSIRAEHGCLGFRQLPFAQSSTRRAENARRP